MFAFKFGPKTNTYLPLTGSVWRKLRELPPTDFTSVCLSHVCLFVCLHLTQVSVYVSVSHTFERKYESVQKFEIIRQEFISVFYIFLSLFHFYCSSRSQRQKTPCKKICFEQAYKLSFILILFHFQISRRINYSQNTLSPKT